MSGNMIPIAGEAKKRICYFFDSDIGNYHYGPGHPMKPHRIRMTHALVMNYGLYKKMEIFRAKPATRKEMAQFHTDDYVDFLSKVTPDNMDEFLKEQAKFNLGDDCPVFDGLFEYCSISAGGSMEGAARLSRDKCDIAVNWAGGLHHAKKAEANGFCYVNDIVLGILELLRYHKRVLYVDIDVHHGDGVEEAFYTTDRVMTCSFHKYGEFFPGTGELRDTGHGKGKHYAVNFPLRDGITDEAYKNIFEPVITKIMETYQPSAIVLQCGGDSLSGDRLGSFNVSMRGHANCVRFIKSLGLPLLLLGGGGYTIRNVSRTWAYETGLAAGQELCPDIPMNEYYEYYGPTYRLDVPPSNMEDMNITKYLEKTKIQIFENLRHTIPVPSVGLQAIPRLPHDEMEVDEDLDDPNERKPQRLLDGLIQRDDEFSDSEDEGEGGRRDVQSNKRARRQSPKFNGSGPLNLHPGSHNSLSQPQRANDLNFNRLVPSRHSSLSSSTTSMNDIHMTNNNEGPSKNTIIASQNYTTSPLSHPPERQNSDCKPTQSDMSHPSTIPAAQTPAVVDIPMLSEEDQIELQKLASEALATSELPLQQPEEPSQTTKMDIDEVVNTPVRPEPGQVQPLASSAGSEIAQPETGTINGSLANASSNPQTSPSDQVIQKGKCQPTGLATSSQVQPPEQQDQQSCSLQLASGSEDIRMEEEKGVKSSEPASANPLLTINQVPTSIKLNQTSEELAKPVSLDPIPFSSTSVQPATVVGAQFMPLASPSLNLGQPQAHPSIDPRSGASHTVLAGQTDAAQMIPLAGAGPENMSIPPHLTVPDPLEGMTDEFVSQVAQAIAEGEAGTGSNTLISCPLSNTTAPNFHASLLNKNSEPPAPSIDPAPEPPSGPSAQAAMREPHEAQKVADGAKDPDTPMALPVPTMRVDDPVAPREGEKDHQADPERRHDVSDNNRPGNPSGHAPIDPSPARSAADVNALPPAPLSSADGPPPNPAVNDPANAHHSHQP